MKDIKIKTIKSLKTDIYFDPKEKKFYCVCGGFRYEERDLSALESALEKSSIKPEGGEYFIKQYDGSMRVRAVRSWVDSYSGKELVYVEFIERTAGSNHDRVGRFELYPVNAHNEDVYRRGKELKEKGWNLIRQGERLMNNLKK